MGRTLTDETREIVRVFMSDGKVATRKEISKQVEDNITRPGEYRVNILNGVIKMLIENKELENVGRGMYKLGEGAVQLSTEQLVERYILVCKENLERMCVFNMATATEEEKQETERISKVAKELGRVLEQYRSSKPGEASVSKEEPVSKAENSEGSDTKVKQGEAVEKIPDTKKGAKKPQSQSGNGK